MFTGKATNSSAAAALSTKRQSMLKASMAHASAGAAASPECVGKGVGPKEGEK